MSGLRTGVDSATWRPLRMGSGVVAALVLRRRSKAGPTSAMRRWPKNWPMARRTWRSPHSFSGTRSSCACCTGVNGQAKLQGYFSVWSGPYQDRVDMVGEEASDLIKQSFL